MAASQKTGARFLYEATACGLSGPSGSVADSYLAVAQKDVPTRHFGRWNQTTPE